jgi:hypothetical protein
MTAKTKDLHFLCSCICLYTKDRTVWRRIGPSQACKCTGSQKHNSKPPLLCSASRQRQSASWRVTDFSLLRSVQFFLFVVTKHTHTQQTLSQNADAHARTIKTLPSVSSQVKYFQPVTFFFPTILIYEKKKKEKKRFIIYQKAVHNIFHSLFLVGLTMQNGQM